MTLLSTVPPAAPFSEVQRAWLTGYLSGLARGRTEAAGAGTPAGPPLVVAHGSQTGSAEGVAADAAEVAAAAGFTVRSVALDDLTIDELVDVRHLVVVTSTYGDGEMPDNAELFWQALVASDAPRLEELAFAVLALGDTGYDEFCQAGRLIDTRLEQLGATRLHARVDCDVDFEDDAAAWVAQVVPVLADAAGASASGATPTPEAEGVGPAWGRKNPFPARVVENRVLSSAGSAKEIRHVEIDLGDSGIEYQAGDALAVVGTNDPQLADALVERWGVDPDWVPDGHDESVRELLLRRFEIRTPSKALVTHVGDATRDLALQRLLHHGEAHEVESWLWGRDVLDLWDLAPLGAEEHLALLRPLQHRAYSISSSPLASPDRIHLTVAAVRHEHEGRPRGGVCSTYLADRSDGAATPVFLMPNQAFRLPAPDVPVVMIGPGTGIAPFRAFLQERAATEAAGPSWLFFGDQHRATDFIYADELEAFQASGALTRLDLAFSRDQAEKVYVQTRMREQGADLWSWLQDGAHVFVCGDASRMAKDVDAALHDVVAQHGGLTPEAAADYVNDLRRTKRYLRDVY